MSLLLLFTGDGGAPPVVISDKEESLFLGDIPQIGMGMHMDSGIGFG